MVQCTIVLVSIRSAKASVSPSGDHVGTIVGNQVDPMGRSLLGIVGG